MRAKQEVDELRRLDDATPRNTGLGRWGKGAKMVHTHRKSREVSPTAVGGVRVAVKTIQTYMPPSSMLLCNQVWVSPMMKTAPQHLKEREVRPRQKPEIPDC